MILFAPNGEKLIGGHDQSADPALRDRCKCRIKLALAASLDNDNLLPDRARCLL